MSARDTVFDPAVQGEDPESNCLVVPTSCELGRTLALCVALGLDFSARRVGAGYCVSLPDSRSLLALLRARAGAETRVLQ
jgi:hypothetical protein